MPTSTSKNLIVSIGSAGERLQRSQPALEVHVLVAVDAVIVRPDAGDVDGVVPQLAHHERRRVDHVVDVLELNVPVPARRRRGVTQARFAHAHDLVADTTIGLERGSIRL
jgi:hypothetical protein